MTNPPTFPATGQPRSATPDPVPPAGEADFAAAPETTPTGRRLTRSRDDKMLGGVCGGLARYFGVDATWVRIGFVASILLPGPQVLIYLLLWLVIPQD